MMYTLEPHGHGMAADIFTLELAKARQFASRAKLALERAEEMLNEDCGVGINIALCSRIRSARRRVIEARERLTRIDPPSATYFRDGP
jgi:hypothetical protein